jgi:hypothetical protein
VPFGAHGNTPSSRNARAQLFGITLIQAASAVWRFGETYRVSITPKGTPLMFVTKWDILSAEEIVSQIAEALAEPS